MSDNLGIPVTKLALRDPLLVGTAEYTPRDVPGVLMWLDPNNTGQTVDTPIATYPDMMGHHPLTQGNPSLRLILRRGKNGNLALEGDGTSTYMKGYDGDLAVKVRADAPDSWLGWNYGAFAPWWMYIVCKNTQDVSDELQHVPLFFGNGSGGDWFTINFNWQTAAGNPGKVISFSNGGASFDQTIVGPNIDTDWHVWRVLITEVTGYIYRDGAVVGQQALTGVEHNGSTVWLGAGGSARNFKGLIGDVVYGAGDVLISDDRLIWSFLSRKWNIPVTTL